MWEDAPDGVRLQLEVESTEDTKLYWPASLRARVSSTLSLHQRYVRITSLSCRRSQCQRVVYCCRDQVRTDTTKPGTWATILAAADSLYSLVLALNTIKYPLLLALMLILVCNFHFYALAISDAFEHCFLWCLFRILRRKFRARPPPQPQLPLSSQTRINLTVWGNRETPWWPRYGNSGIDLSVLYVACLFRRLTKYWVYFNEVDLNINIISDIIL